MPHWSHYPLLLLMAVSLQSCSGTIREEKIQRSYDEPQGKTSYGKASYYASSFNGHRTASGEPLNNSKLTAAHRQLPFGTQVKVTNKSNGKSVVVTINDRGPFTRGHTIDLTQAAFERIAPLRQGVVSVEIQRISN